MSERNSTHTQIDSGVTAYYGALQKHIDYRVEQKFCDI